MATWNNWTKGALAGGTAIGLVAAVLLANGYKDTTLLSVTDGTESADTAFPAPAPGRIQAERSRVEMPEAAQVGSAMNAAPPPSAPKQALEKMAPQAEIMMDQVGGVAPEIAREAIIAPMPYPGDMAVPQPEENRDRFEGKESNPVKVAAEEPVSTFSMEVDTASYSVVRRSLTEGHLPPKEAVRIEEMVNYFDYDYPLPESREQPFKPTVALYPSPWNEDRVLMHVGIKGFDVVPAERPRANLVFLIDTSGSMQDGDKLPLLSMSIQMMVQTLDPEDTVAFVTYAGSAGVALEPTKVKEREKIFSALGQLYAEGSTAGAEGLKTAYQLAEANFDEEAVNRVILATDGDFNVGISDPDQLETYIERKRDTGIFLSVLGFGRGNYNDALMQRLAQNGNGTAAYIDTVHEARKILVDEASGTLFPIAKDVKVQVEFNPERVAEYRLVGYETRMLNREDFNNDKVDAGEIGAGHSVTAIYELTLADSETRSVDGLRYGEQTVTDKTKPGGEYAFVKLRYKLPDEDKSKLLTRPVTEADRYDSIAKAPEDMKFAASVAGFGEILKGGEHTGDWDFEDAIALAQEGKGKDEDGYRQEFIKLLKLAPFAKEM